MTDATAAIPALALPERPTPPRFLRIFLAAYWTLLVGFFAFVLWKLIAGELVIIWSNPWFGSFAFVGIAFLVIYRAGRTQTVRRFLSPHSGFICPRCHYSLRALDDEGVCPECGTQYTRASVVALWEHAYSLGHRYPRVSPRTARDPLPSPKTASSQGIVPWSKWSLPDALAKVEAGARRRGFASARFNALAREFDEACAKLARPLPMDLHAVLAWFDPALWQCFVHQLPPQTQAASPTEPASGISPWLAQSALPTQQVSIRRPAEIVVATLAEHARTRPETKAFAESLSLLSRPPSWLDTQLIAFADAHSGEVIYYCTDPPDLPRGCIVTFRAGASDRLWLADALGQWLTRLAVCDGREFAFPPDDASPQGMQLREAFRAASVIHNPARTTADTASQLIA